jgi:hypothetical protein
MEYDEVSGILCTVCETVELVSSVNTWVLSAVAKPESITPFRNDQRDKAVFVFSRREKRFEEQACKNEG